jgi:two-component system, chemotaxis family, chemotaxis protein CheY
MIKKVLIIEKHDALRALIALITRPAYEVFKARDAVEGMAWIHLNQKPDIIIADAELIDEHGDNLLYTLRCSGVYGDIPVVVLGEQANQAAQDEYLRLGAVAYFNMPFQPDSLLALLHKLVPAEQPSNYAFPVRPLKIPNRVLAFDR